MRRVRSPAFFLSFKQQVAKDFPDLFGQGDQDLSPEANFGRKWGWYASVDVLADGDLTKHDQVIDMPLYQCLTKLVYEQDKAKMVSNRTKAV